MDQKGTKQQCRHSVRRYAKGEQGDESTGRTGIVGRFRPGDTRNSPLAELLGMFREPTLRSVGPEQWVACHLEDAAPATA